MALGIMGLAITALLGLLPQGLEMSKKAGNATAQARIMDTVSARLNNMSFQGIDTVNNQMMYFDDQGIQVDSSRAQMDGAYVVRVVVRDAGVGAKLPGVGAGQPLLRTVVVQIAAAPGGRFNFDDARNNRSFQTVALNVGPFIP